ncbi:MAG: DUF4125 family protein [Christensenella sp.]|nr:DUF4125 family protein [Christensenella sp.]
MDGIIDEILGIEWKMFDAVQNRNGRADCQDDLKTFTIMRGSQFRAWSEELLKSYLDDLLEAKKEGRNLLSEKYARMMEHTFPQEYADIEGSLPPLSEEAKQRIGKIASVQVAWLEDFAKRYPYVAGNGRPIHSSEDSPYGTSFETYLKGELATYSEATLRKYEDFLAGLQRESRNMNEEILTYTSLAYGYTSVSQAEEALAKRQRG